MHSRPINQLHTLNKKYILITRLFHTRTKCLFSLKDCQKFEGKPIPDKFSVEGICSPKVIVIGAGMAGLSAAEALIQSGITDVKVIEATNRAGGRIQSCVFGNVIADLGAQWITGSTIANSIITLAARENVIGPPLHLYNYKSGTYLRSDGHPINANISSHASIAFDQIKKQAYTAKGHGSLMNYFILRIEKELKNFPSHQQKDAARVMYGLTNKLKNRWGADLTSLSPDLFHSFKKLDGETYGVPQGFISVISPLIKKISDKNLYYSKTVNCISWGCNDDARVKVTTCDGCVFLADYVIFTASLGVLKAYSKTLFSPPLPEEKEDAIKKLGYGNINKLFMEYKEPFWMTKSGPIKLAWSVDELNSDSWVKGIDSIVELPCNHQMIMTTVSGKHADEFEKISDMEVVHDITDFFRKLTNNMTIPFPTAIMRSKWRSSKFFQGSNAYLDLLSTKGHFEDLASPIPCSDKSDSSVIPKIFFAGEATSKKFFSTVNGARLSGLNAAQSIITLTKKLGRPPPLD